MTRVHLAAYLEESAARYPGRPAVVDSIGRAKSYLELNRQADALAGFLAGRGVRAGDRVGIAVPKSLEAVVALFGVIKAGAAYVPLDCAAPVERNRRILADCDVRALIGDRRSLDLLPAASEAEAPVVMIAVGFTPDGHPSATPFDAALAEGGDPPDVDRRAEDLAYIIHTSGSTGAPKGVMMTHRNACAFVDWCSSVYAPGPDDRFSSHPPFHFDPSVFDLYLAIKHGASIHLISDELSKNPKDLARFVVERRLTSWLSTASTLVMLVRFGRLHDHEASSLKFVSFGGEVLPVKYLRELQRLWPSAAFFNQYGPTETATACTIARIPSPIPDSRTAPYPIGFPADHCRTLVLDSQGREVEPGATGLLHISGDSVSPGYWKRPAETAAAFPTRDGTRWYNTGDLVRWDPSEGFTFLGRADRMVKRRGYRIELDEIELALERHPGLERAAVVAVPDETIGVRIVAFVSGGQDRPSIIELKTFCAATLPGYMSPDRFVFQDRLPGTSTDKVDYQVLRNQLLDAVAG